MEGVGCEVRTFFYVNLLFRQNLNLYYFVFFLTYIETFQNKRIFINKGNK